MGGHSRYERHTPVEIATAPGWTAETLLGPAPFYGANGIRIAPDGRCFVAQFRGGCLSAWDPETGAIEDVAAPGGPLDGPDDLAFGPDGAAYVTEYRAGKVVRLRDGVAEPVLLESPSANGITVDREGRLYVTEFRAGGRLIEAALPGPGTGRVIADLDFPNAFARGPDGRIYVQHVIAGTVSSLEPDGGGLRLELEGFQMPSALKFDPRGRVVVVEFTTGLVIAADLATGERETLATLAPGLDNLDFDAAGRLYVSSGTASQVVRIAAGAVEAATPSGLTGPFDVAVTDDGTVYAADILRVARISGTDAETVWQMEPPARAFQVFGIACARDTLYAVTGTGDLRRIDPASGTHELVAEGDVVAVAAWPGGAVAARKDGRLVEIGAGERVSGLATVTAVAGAPGALAACDAEAGIAVVLGDGARTLTGLAGPEGIALGADGTLYVAETAARRVTMHPRDGAPVALATGLPLGFPLPGPRNGRRASLALGADGALVLGCDGDGSIRRLRMG